jgi:hypothetical protein
MHINVNANVNVNLHTGDEVDISHFSRPAETRMMHANCVDPRVGGAQDIGIFMILFMIVRNKNVEAVAKQVQQRINSSPTTIFRLALSRSPGPYINRSRCSLRSSYRSFEKPADESFSPRPRVLSPRVFKLFQSL